IGHNRCEPCPILAPASEAPLRLSRRSLIRTGLLATLPPVLNRAFDRVGLPLAPSAAAQETEWLHALSLFGEIKYPAGFKQFDYVNAQAPKAGTARLIALGTFDNLNLVVSGVRGSIAQGVTFIYNTLTTPSLDEVSTEYGLLAEAVRYPADYSTVT